MRSARLAARNMAGTETLYLRGTWPLAAGVISTSLAQSPATTVIPHARRNSIHHPDHYRAGGILLLAVETLLKTSFLIPARNEADTLTGLLRSIEAAMGERDYEIFVGDHNSTDATVYIASMFDSTRVVDCSVCTTVAEVRNRLASYAADTDVFVFLDADTRLSEVWGLNYKPEDIKPRAIYGSYPQAVECGWMNRVWFNNIYRNRTFIGSGHLIVQPTVFFGLGMFDPTLVTGEDYDFCLSAFDRNYSITERGDLPVFHLREPKTLKSFFLRELWHGTGDWKGLLPRSGLAFYCAVFTVNLVAGLVMIAYHPLGWVPLAMALVQLVFLTSYKVPFNLRFIPALGLTYLYMLARALSVFQFRRRV